VDQADAAKEAEDFKKAS
jgi:hypothetical protein